MSEPGVHFVIGAASFIASAGFTAGMQWASILRTRRDVDGIGRKVNVGEKVAARRYHNISLAVMQVAPPAKESEISQLLKEECNQ